MLYHTYLKRKMETRRFTQTNIPRSHPSCMHGGGGSHRLNYTQHRNNQYLIKVKTIHNITITQIVELDCYVYFYILTSFIFSQTCIRLINHALFASMNSTTFLKSFQMFNISGIWGAKPDKSSEMRVCPFSLSM